MAIYTLTTNVLSAAKTGNPPLANVSLSATGVTYLSGAGVVLASKDVGVVSLSSDDIGLAFNPVNFSAGTTVYTASSFNISNFSTVTVNVLGSVFNIPNSLHNTTLAVVNPDRTYTTFTWLSSTTTVPVSALSDTKEVSTPDFQRKRLLGYF